MGILTTAVWLIDAVRPDPAVLAEAGALLRKGKLVAFPTETVYGLGANALDAEAVGALFAAKGRPADNPLTLHLAGVESLTPYVAEIPAAAAGLMEIFWPGPLTIVFKSAGILPRAVTGGLDTIAARIPAHPVALGLIRAARIPVVAPSANLSGRPSPTTAAHVLDDLAGRIHIVLDGGPTPIGIESTVLDLTGKSPVILRPGAVAKEEIAAVVGVAAETIREAFTERNADWLRSRLILVEGPAGPAAQEIVRLYERFALENKTAGIVTRKERVSNYPGPVVGCGRAGDARSAAAGIYAALRQLENMDVILVESAPGDFEPVVRERLRRAAFQVIGVRDAR
jgi:L-threonylcarbamoyladenylate synthase